MTTTQGAATPSDSALDALARQLPAGSPIRQARERGASWQAIAPAAGLTVAVLFAIMAVELFGPSVISRLGFLNALRFGRFGSKTATAGGLRKYDIVGSTKPFRSKNSKLVRRNIEVRGGEQKAREMFRDLTGKEATGAEKQEVGKVGQTVYVSSTRRSGHPKVDVHTLSFDDAQSDSAAATSVGHRMGRHLIGFELQWAISARYDGPVGRAIGRMAEQQSRRP